MKAHTLHETIYQSGRVLVLCALIILCLLVGLVVALEVRAHASYAERFDAIELATHNQSTKSSDMCARYECPECHSVLLLECHAGDVLCTGCRINRKFTGWWVFDEHKGRGMPQRKQAATTVSLKEGRRFNERKEF